jgi:hypothetical protein
MGATNASFCRPAKGYFIAASGIDVCPFGCAGRHSSTGAAEQPNRMWCRLNP